MRIDNFALTMFQSCPSKYNLRIRQGWRSRRKSGALGFGGAVHAGLAEWHRGSGLDVALAAIDKAWDPSVPADDYRTVERAKEVLRRYANQYPTESFRPVVGPSGPLIEVPFTLPTGQTLDDGEDIDYGGIFDGLVEFGGSIYVLEHKTTSRLGASFFTQFKPNNQVTGYVWAGQELSGARVGGAIINAICVTPSGKISFERQVTTRSPEDIQHWLSDLQHTCQMIRNAERTDAFPQFTPSCVQYGRCEFHDVHVLSNATDQQRRLESDYIIDPWEYERRDESAPAGEGVGE